REFRLRLFRRHISERRIRFCSSNKTSLLLKSTWGALKRSPCLRSLPSGRNIADKIALNYNSISDPIKNRQPFSFECRHESPRRAAHAEASYESKFGNKDGQHTRPGIYALVGDDSRLGIHCPSAGSAWWR